MPAGEDQELSRNLAGAPQGRGADRSTRLIAAKVEAGGSLRLPPASVTRVLRALVSRLLSHPAQEHPMLVPQLRHL
jgi:hypothetical protein